MKNTYINKIEFYLPLKVENNFEIVKKLKIKSGLKIIEKIGIKKRRVSKISETTIDLATKVGKKINKNILKKIDFIIFCSQTPDYIIPSSSSLLQKNLNLSNKVGTIDLIQGCSGYNYGINIADSLIKSNQANNVLLITSDTYSKFISSNDISTRLIFSDGSSATLVSSLKNRSAFKIIDHDRGTDGSGSNYFIFEKFGSKNLTNKKLSENFIEMNGSKIFDFTIKKIPLFIKHFLKKNKLDIQDIDHFFLHQASSYILNHLKNKMHIMDEKFHSNLENVGNTVSSSIPILLKSKEKFIKKNEKIVLVGFGVGLSWSISLLIKI